jgi:hypothetical protein
VTRPPFDREAVRRGVTVACAFAVPAVAISWLTDKGPGQRGPVGLLTLVVLVGLLLGGFAAASQQSVNAPLTHALLAVLSVVVVLQVARIARLAVLHRPLNLPASVGNLLFGLVAALLGALLAGQNTAKRGSAK